MVGQSKRQADNNTKKAREAAMKRAQSGYMKPSTSDFGMYILLKSDIEKGYIRRGTYKYDKYLELKKKYG